MSATTPEQTERLVQFSRRQLWTVLVILLLLGASHLVDLVFKVNIPPVLGIAISIAAACGMGRWLKTDGVDFSASSPAMQAVRNDELRQLAQAKAFRNGFFVLLAWPLICAYALTWLGVANPLPIVVGSGAWLGAVTFLASLLWLDR